MAEIPLPASGAACKTCRFWAQYQKTITAGTCRVRGPSIFGHMRSPEERGIWPLTVDNEWCGEYQPVNGGTDA